MSTGKYGAITDVKGIKVGHFTDLEAITGCTVVICEEGATGGVKVSGKAPATRETDLLKPGMLIERIHAILLTGGSSFGLESAYGVMAYLEENKIGFKTRESIVPIVPGAAIYDLNIGRADIRPDKKMGYDACKTANSGPVEQGSVGCGTGATVGRILGRDYIMKGGIGTASCTIEDITNSSNITIGSIMAVNSLGNIYDPTSAVIYPKTGEIDPEKSERIAGCYDKGNRRFVEAQLGEGTPFTNTTIGVVALDANLTKQEANELAAEANKGLKRIIYPVNTLYDGDAIFVMATSKKKHSELTDKIKAAAIETVTRAVYNAIVNAKSLGGILSYGDIRR